MSEPPAKPGTIASALAVYSRNQQDLASIGGGRPLRSGDQAGLSEAIADGFEGKCKYIPELKSWTVYDGYKWSEDRSGSMLQVAKLAARAAADRAEMAGNPALGKAFRSLLSAPKLKGALEIAATDPRLVDSLNRFDCDPFTINTQSGLFNFITGALEPHQPEHLCMKITGAGLDFDADTQIFDRFINDISAGRLELAAWLIARLGYYLTADTSLQEAAFHLGMGANGKGVFQKLIQALWGDYAGVVKADMLLERDIRGGTGPNPEMLAIRGQRVIFASETPDGAKINEARLKALVGEDDQTARGMHSGLMVTFKPVAKFILSTNHAPRLGRVDFALRRRIRLVPFDRVFMGDVKDPLILEKLLEERDGILGTIVRAAQAFTISRQLPPCSIVDSASSDYLDGEDLIIQWISACARLSDGAATLSSDLYKNFTAWSEREGRRPWTANAFGRALTEHGLELEPKGGVGRRKGISLL